jgi:hypothetical protein
MIKIEPVFLDSAEISQVCKISIKRIGFFVKKYGLPAFKDGEGKNVPWKARPEALKEWAEKHEKQFLER